MEIIFHTLSSGVILVSVTTLTLLIGVCLTSIKNMLSIRVEMPMNMVVLFMLIGLPFIHFQFSYPVATLLVVTMTLILNAWVMYTMHVEQLQTDEKGI